MKIRWLAVFALTLPLFAEAPVQESPVKEPALIESASPAIELPSAPPPETTTPLRAETSAEPISVTEKDPQDPGNWRLYDNRVVKAHLRVKPSWTVMEFKESDTIGTVSFTLSRLPLVTVAIVRSPLQDTFEAYVRDESLAPLYTKILKKRPGVVGGRKGIVVVGTLEDGRQDDSHFSTDGKSFYRISFSAPADHWKDTEKQFEQIERDFRWKN